MKQDGSLTLENRSRTLPQTTDCHIFFGYPYGQRQFSAKQLIFFGEDHSGNLASLCRNESIQVNDSSAVQVDLLMKVIYENTIAWYTCIEIMNCQIVLVIVYITVMKMPAVEKESLENIPDSEKIGSSVVDEVELPAQQHSLDRAEEFKARDTEGGQRFLRQPSDIQSHTMKDSIQHNPTRKFLEWFDGGGNTPFHISGKLLDFVFTAMSIIVPFGSSVIKTRLSTHDLKIFTYFTFYWLIMSTFTHDLLKRKCSNKTKLCSRKAGLTSVDTYRKGCIWEEEMSDQTYRTDRNMMEQKRHSKGRGRVGVIYNNRSKAVHRTDAFMPGAGFLSCFKISKIGYGVLILLLVFPAQAAGSPVKDKDKKSNSEMLNRYFPLLTSDVCKNPEIKYKCPDFGSVMMNDKARHCEYTCKTYEILTCLNSDEGAVYFCIPKSTKCDPGIFWQVEQTDSNMVVINESFCPEGNYQSKESKCFNACTARHFQLHLIPEMFKVYRKRDHFHPTILICDYTAGFYNAYNKSFMNFDNNFIDYQDFCTHINVSNPCAQGQMPLYNGTCVDKCRLGYMRDENDYFCKQVDENSVVHIQTSEQAPASTSRPAGVSKLTTQNVSSWNNDKKSDEAYSFPWYIIVILGIFFLCVIISLIVKVWCKKNETSRMCTYQTVSLHDCTIQCTTRGSSGTSLARDSVGSDDTVKDTSIDLDETAEKKIAPSSDSLNGYEPVAESGRRKDVLTETEVRNSCVSSHSKTGPTVKKTVQKKTEYKRNIMIRIENIGSINIGDKVENMTDFLCQLSEALGIPVSQLIKQNDTDADLGETESKETDICDSRDIHSERDASIHDSTVIENPDDLNGIEIDCDQQESDKDEEIDVDVTNAAVGRLAGQEFSKPYNNAMTQFVINAVAEYMKSVGALIFNGQIVGTVFRAGDNCVITAFHVIQGIIDPERSGNYNFVLLESENVFITFSASVCETAGMKYRVRHRLSSNDPRLDYAVLEVTDRTDMLPKKLKLDKGRFERLQVNLLSGIGYGNPLDIFSKTFDPNCPVISSIDQKIADCQNWLTENLANISFSVPNAVNIGYDNIDKDQNIFLDISMRHRGSGSPFLTNEGFVVGMLTHGHPEFYFRLPANIQSAFPADKKFESLLRLEYMFLDIQSRDQTLANELF